VETVGRYRLRRLLGEGALGLVYEAVGEDGATVAVKVLRPERAGDASARARFVREARLAARIASRHVVPVLEVGESYLVLPFYPRGSLAQRLREEGRLGLGETVRLAAELGRGLDALHEHGILHRDVKPSNVLVAGDGTAALADFGLARASDSTRITHDGQLVGTPHYLAPELVEGSEATRASDLYALGCLLYECVAGEPPFTGRPAEIGFAHLTEAPPDPRERRPELSGEVALALLAALEKDPQARPTSGTALARMLHVAHSASPA
jgi:eukaryotic-like serine/threonine-protein kinase